jgi:hypothetical protein
LLWAEESEEVLLNWWTSPRGDGAILQWVQQLVSDVEADLLWSRYKVTELATERRQFAIDSPLSGVCAVIEILEDERVLLVNILTEHPSQDDFEPP